MECLFYRCAEKKPAGRERLSLFPACGSIFLADECVDVRDVRAKEMFPAASLLFRHRLGCLQEADMLHDFLDFLHVDWLRGVGVAAELEGFLDIVDV